MDRRKDSVQGSLTEELIDKIKRPRYTPEQIQRYRNEQKWYFKILKFFRIY
jgi:hypothetical protein